MSPQQNAYKAYNKAFHTVGKTRQVVMLYDGAIRFLKQAKEAMEQKKIMKRYRLLTRVSEIILGLQASLDFDNGQAVAKTLYDFYSSVDARILTLHRTNDAASCQALIDELKEMRDAWATIDQGVSTDKPAAKPERIEHSFDMAAMPATPASIPLSSDLTC